ncbi:PhnE/PtxC family ABC transporter permease [Craterilacuibacter sp.]|uniref:PhnE/PtxC family ABC transporter permease n=1 Tax=Craterilacuibacter sp. TaxID=2870909 RepID=UPI003F35F51D
MLDPAPSSMRDPARRPRLLATLALMLLLAPAFQSSGFHPAALLDSGSWTTLAQFVSGFFPPAHERYFLDEVAGETAVTLASATLGIALAMLIAIPAAFASCAALDTPGSHHPVWQAGQSLLRGMLVVLRAIPEIVWALLFVRAVGLGSLPAVLAIGLAYGGMLGKVYAEILDSQPAEACRALAIQGASRGQRLGWALLPQAMPELVSYSVYRWECAIRASAVMGFVGAGGIGQLLDTSIKMMNGGEVSTLLLVFVLLVMMSDGISRLARAALHTGYGQALLLAGVLLALGASLLCLAPAWLAGGFDFKALPAFAAEFWPPDSGPDLFAGLAQGMAETLAMSVTGTVLACLFAAWLSLPAAGLMGVLPQAVARLLLNLLRGVPDLMWAALAVLLVGLGPAAGVLALCLHTSGVLGRLFAETLENAPREPVQALLLSGASPTSAFCYGLLPAIMTQWLAYSLYRWENNIRIAAVLGIVGAGGIGQQLFMALSLFQTQTAASLMLAMVLLSWTVERLSRWLRRQLAGPA